MDHRQASRAGEYKFHRHPAAARLYPFITMTTSGNRHRRFAELTPLPMLKMYCRDRKAWKNKKPDYLLPQFEIKFPVLMNCTHSRQPAEDDLHLKPALSQAPDNPVICQGNCRRPAQ